MKIRRKYLFIFVPVLLLVFTGQAFAHAMPTSYQPEASAIVAQVPGKVQIGFSERVQPSASSITVLGPNGVRVDNGDAHVDPADHRSYGTTIRNAGDGTYTVSWQVVSADDGHFSKGAFVFSVGHATGAALAVSSPPQAEYSSTLPEALTNWLELLGQSIMFSGIFILIFVWRPAKRVYGLEDSKLKKRFSKLVAGGAVLVIAGAASYLVMKSYDLHQTQGFGAVDAFGTLIGTRAGSYTLFRGVLAFLFLGVFLARRQKIVEGRRIISFEEVLLLSATALTELSMAMVSHSAASPFHPTLSVFITFVHVAGKDLWVGALIVMALIFEPALRKAKERGAMAFSMIRLAKIISVTLGVAGAAGVYIVWLDLKDFSSIFTTDWGILFTEMAGLASVLLVLRLFQQLVVNKAAVAHLSDVSNKKDLRRMGMSGVLLKTEALVGIAVLLFTGMIIITTPPEPQKTPYQQSVMSGEVHITLAEDPLDANVFSLSFENMNDGKPIDTTKAIVATTNNKMNIGPLEASTTKKSTGEYTFPKSALSPPGVWRIEVTGQRPGAYDAVASFQIDYPDQLGETGTGRQFDSFAAAMVISALLIAGLAIVLYQSARGLGKNALKEIVED